MANTWGAMRSYLMEPDELDLVEVAPSRFPASAAQVTKAPRADITQPDRVSVKNTAGVVQKDQDEESEQAKRAKTAIRFAGPEELGPTLDMLRGLPEFEAQRQAADDFENQLAMMREMPTANEAAWVKPLLALADSQTGSNLMKGYTEPTANKDRWQTLLKYGDEVARRKGDIAKNLLEGISKTKSGTDIEQFIRNVKAIDAIENKTGQENFTGDGFVAPPKPTKGGKGGGQKSLFYDNLNKKFGMWAAEFLAGGGTSSAASDAATLKKIANKLKSGELKTGTAEGFLASAGKVFGVKTNLQEVADEIARTSVNSLKGIFPGAISNAEREFIVTLSFDPKASPKSNYGRLMKAARIIEKGNAATQRALQHATETGDMRGYTGWDFQSAPGMSGGGMTREQKIQALKAKRGGK